MRSILVNVVPHFLSNSRMKIIISLIQTLPRPVFMAKSDIANAFRLVPITPHQYHLVGFYLEGDY